MISAATIPAAEPLNISSVPALSNAAQILKLSTEQVKANPPVRINGVVTCYDHGRVLFVQDESAGVYVYLTGDRLPIQPGQHLQVTGSAKQGLFSPYIDSPVIKTLESGPTVVPQPVSLAQVEYGGLDAQWVELTGVVRAQKLLDSRLWLEVADPPHRIHVWIPDYQGYEQLALTDSLVRLRGVVGSRVSRAGQLEGFQIFANSTADVTVLHPPATDPFSTPPHLIQDLKTHMARNGARGRIRVRGIVTLSEPGRGVFIQDATGGLEVRTQTPLDGFVPGTVVDVAGYPGSLLDSPLVEDALLRKLETNAAPQPQHLSPDDLFQGRYNNQLVEVEVQFLGRVHTPSNALALAVQANNRFLTAVLNSPPSPATLASLQPGCGLRLTGVCHPQAGLGDNSNVELLLRSEADVIVTHPGASAQPAALRVFPAAALLACVGLVAALLFIRKQRQRTEQLLQLQSVLQTEMRQGEQQLRRSMEERERIGRDLHDDIIQSIYAAGLGLEDCRRVIRQSPEQAEPRLLAAIQTLNDTIRGVRGFIAGLEPKVLSGREFKTALKSLALTSGEGPTQFQFQVDSTAANNLTSTQATQLLHIAKEAMSNSLRHANTSSVTVSLQPVSNGVRLEICDDGVGFDPRVVGGTGQGLRNMAARAREIGGELQTISSPGQGCRILVTVAQRNSDEPD